MLLVVAAGMVAGREQRGTRTDAPPTSASRRSDDTASTSRHGLTIAQRAAGVARRQPTPPAELRRRVAALASGTYVADILREQDSTLYRWPERLNDAVRVYVEPTSNVPDWNDALPNMTRDVFGEWSLTGFPLRFAFVYDSVDADVWIRWRDRFPDGDGQRIGVTERTQSSDFLIVRATISIALHDSAGRVFPAPFVAGIVRHEVGHALGLNHASDSTSVMFADAATSTLSASDHATLRLLYLVPPGTLKD
ncbi:MAG: matrixin family metalloprotease [Gemmatimonadaceae bacterium]|nr:matrixin family metalloprotease [Gemmatimonadaceae bacterium]